MNGDEEMIVDREKEKIAIREGMKVASAHFKAAVQITRNLITLRWLGILARLWTWIEKKMNNR